jgi:hypothetical protein
MPVGTTFATLASIREDFGNFIFQTSPLETPVYSFIPDGDATARNHEWPVRDIAVRTDNAQIEGYSYDFTVAGAAPELPVRARNFTQIFSKQRRISRTNAWVTHAGIADLVKDQLGVMGVAAKTDCELALNRGSLASGNASSVAQRLAGLLNIASTNATTAASGTSFSETLLNDWMQAIYGTTGVLPTHAVTPGPLKRRFSAFTDNITRFADVTDKTIDKRVTAYASDFGPIMIILSRYALTGANANSLMLFRPDFCKKAWGQRPDARMAGETAASWDVVTDFELTLEFGNEKAHAAYFGLN